MAEEFINRGGVCSGNRWNPSRNILFRGCLSPCSGVAASMASFGWPAESNFCGLASPGNCDWTQGLLFDDGASNGIMTSNQSNPNNIVLETGLSDTSQIQRNWSPGLNGSFSGNLVEDQDSPRFSAFSTPINFPAQASENYSNHNISFSSTYPSTMNKSSLLDQPPTSVFENQPTAPAADYPTQLVPNYGSICSDDSSPASFVKLPSPLKPNNSSLPNPPQSSRFQFSNKTPYWNASLSALDVIRASLLASPQSTLSVGSCDEKPIRSSKATKVSGSVGKKANQEPAFKRARIETPSPMPTFKVRKEKLGDRITTLQQLVSPFGKTDTASVLHEAIEYIKFLHDQVNVLTTPYTKNGAPFQDQQVSAEKLMKDAEGPNVDLKSRGLCLVPISSTFPVTSETPTDIWMPTFRGSFR